VLPNQYATTAPMALITSAVTSAAVQRGDDYECDRSTWHCDGELIVTVYGPHRALTGAVA
jgi:hypothetical protein